MDELTMHYLMPLLHVHQKREEAHPTTIICTPDNWTKACRLALRKGEQWKIKIEPDYFDNRLGFMSLIGDEYCFHDNWITSEMFNDLGTDRERLTRIEQRWYWPKTNQV